MKKWTKKALIVLVVVVAYVNIGHLVNEGLWRVQFYGREATVSLIMFPAPETFGVGDLRIGNFGEEQMREGAATFEGYHALKSSSWKVWGGVSIWPLILAAGWIVAAILWIVQVLVWALAGLVIMCSFLFTGGLTDLMLQAGFWWDTTIAAMIAGVLLGVAHLRRHLQNKNRKWFILLATFSFLFSSTVGVAALHNVWLGIGNLVGAGICLWQMEKLRVPGNA